MKKSIHELRGGKRDGAGRKHAKHGPTTVIRVPLAIRADILKTIHKFKTNTE